MPSPESQELQIYIDELVKATREGTFQWKSVNPTTYVWQKSENNGSGARLVLQRVEQTVARPAMIGRPPTLAKVTSYILQVIEVSPGGLGVEKLKVSGTEDPAVNEKLEALFQLIISGFSQQGLDFLKSLIHPSKG